MSSDKRRISFVKLSERDLKDLGLFDEIQNTQTTCEPGTRSEERRLSFVKLSQRNLKDLGFVSVDSENTQDAHESGTRSEERRLSFVELSQRDLKDLGFASVDSEKTQDARESGNKFVGQNPRKKQNIFPRPNLRSVTSIHKTRSSTISRRSSVFKKESKRKSVTRINSFLYNTVDKNTSSKNDSSKKIIDAVDKAGKFGARKELFKIPVAKQRIRNEQTTVNQSPLMDIEKAEILLKKKACMKNSLFKPFPLPPPVAVPKLSIVNEEAQCLSPSTSGATIQNTNRKNSYPDLEFEIVEKICEQGNTNTEFPTEVTLIYEILKKDNEEFHRYTEAREERMNKIFKILNVLQNNSKVEVGLQPTLCKEKHQLVTEDHLNTSTPTSQTPVSRKKVGIFSPNTSNNFQNLRINLLRTCVDKSGNKTPKEKKAQNMYNNLRKTFSLLETPKFDKTGDEKLDKNISTKLQEQCLLLLETPLHK